MKIRSAQHEKMVHLSPNIDSKQQIDKGEERISNIALTIVGASFAAGNYYLSRYAQQKFANGNFLLILPLVATYANVLIGASVAGIGIASGIESLVVAKSKSGQKN